jgi:hypothetical protein
VTGIIAESTMQGVSVTLGLPNRHRDILYARRLLLMLRECSDTGQCAGTCLMLSLNRTGGRLSLLLERLRGSIDSSIMVTCRGAPVRRQEPPHSFATSYLVPLASCPSIGNSSA